MNTKIANRIYINDPSTEVQYWAEDNLKFPNPEYEKKQRMGFWLGRTPKELRLYEWDGNTLILPFGVIREIMPLLRGTRVDCDFRQDSIIDYGGKSMGLYDYQKVAVQKMIDARYGILKSKPGSGKTQMGIALIKILRRRALWLCHTADLLNQSRDRAMRYMDDSLIGTIMEGKVNVGAGVTFATVQTMANLELQQYRDYWDVVIVDECFPWYTIIETEDGFKYISDITKCDSVLTISEDGTLVYKKVLNVFQKVPQSLLKITLTNGKTLYCTANHPILTKGGYKHADKITSLDAVCCLRETNGYIRRSAISKIQLAAWKGARFLFGRMSKKSREFLDRRAERKIETINDSAEQEECIETNERKQPNEKSKRSGKRVKNTSRDRTQTKDSWRKRKRNHGTAKDYGGCTERIDPVDRICSPDKGSSRERISDLLQTGHCDSGDQTRRRSGRQFTLCNRTAKSGQKERQFIEYVGVDRVEVQKQTGDGTYGGLCPDGYVYNIEVEDNHNYFANGINVHNCHRVSSSATSFTRYEKVLNHLSARHKYGLTGTPERSDGLIRATFALIGGVAYEVPDSAVADRTMQVKIRPVPTMAEITDECLNDDGTINYVKLIGHLTTDVERNKLIARKIVEEKGHSCLVLSDRLEQLETIRNLLPYEMQEESAYINGKMQSKAAKAEREQALEDMRTGKKKYLFSSFSLSKEGLDVPRLDRLFLASPAKFSAVITQSVGRVQRTFEGKETPVVYDFVDYGIGFCMGAYRKRCTSYRKMGAEIEKGY